MATENFPTYILLDDAAEKYHLDHQTLTRLVESSKIQAVKIGGKVAVAEEEIMGIALDLDDNLQGQPIRAIKAAKKYQVGHANLSRWADYGYIRIIQRRNRLLILDEADVKRAATIFKQALEVTNSSVRAGWILKRSIQPFA